MNIWEKLHEKPRFKLVRKVGCWTKINKLDMIINSGFEDYHVKPFVSSGYAIVRGTQEKYNDMYLYEGDIIRVGKKYFIVLMDNDEWIIYNNKSRHNIKVLKNKNFKRLFNVVNTSVDTIDKEDVESIVKYGINWW